MRGWNSVFFCLLLVVCVLCVEAAKNCPDNCENHGTCVGHHCRCDTGYYGADCSQEIEALRAGQIVRGSIEPRQWAYFSYPVLQAGQEAYFNLQEGPAPGDCDLYLREGAPPTRRHWDKRDIGTEPIVDLKVKAEDQRGTWYAGVFGFLNCQYTMSVSAPSVPCPVGCSGRGTCIQGECLCNAGFGGIGCVSVNKTLIVSQPVEGRVKQGEWAFFYYDVTQPHERYTLEMDAVHDADLYARKGQFPTRFEWDALNSSVPEGNMHDLSSLVFEDVDVGRWYFGVYGYEASTFTITIRSQDFGGTTCDNMCSGESHGSCVNGRCNCNNGYTGSACEYSNNGLLYGAQSGFVDENQWNYYLAHTFSDRAINIHLEEQNPDADCDLYVNRGSYPTRTNFTQAHLGFEDTFTLTVEDVGQETYYVGVFGWRTCSYSISMVEEDPADCGCQNGATCSESGECECSDQWGGIKCEVPVVSLVPGSPKTSSVKQNEWKFFRLPTAASRSYSFSMHEAGSDPGQLWLYVNNRDTPTLDMYDMRENSEDSPMHLININFDEADERNFVLGVYGSPFIPDPTQEFSFTVDAWYFPEQ